MPNVFHDIRKMHDHYNLPIPDRATPMDSETAKFRTVFLIEEITEFQRATTKGDFYEQVDALIDLIVVASGTLDLMGVDGERHWNEVLRANLQKERVSSASESKRNSPIDLKKPEGWEPPDHRSILMYAIRKNRNAK